MNLNSEYKKSIIKFLDLALNNENYDASEFVDDPRLEDLIDQYQFENKRFVDLRNKYNEMKLLMEEPLPSVYSIDKAVPSFRKVSPSLTLNVAIGGVVFFLLVLAIRLIFDKWVALKNATEA